MLTRDAFRAEIEAFIARSGMTATAFGVEAVRDPNFVHDLRNGRAPNLRSVERVLAFIRDRDRPPRLRPARAGASA